MGMVLSRAGMGVLEEEVEGLCPGGAVPQMGLRLRLLRPAVVSAQVGLGAGVVLFFTEPGCRSVKLLFPR